MNKQKEYHVDEIATYIGSFLLGFSSSAIWGWKGLILSVGIILLFHKNL